MYMTATLPCTEATIDDQVDKKLILEPENQ